MSKKPILITVCSIYLLGSIIAFGHASNHLKPSTVVNPDLAMVRFSVDVAVASALWPYYLSMIMFEKPDQTLEK